MTLTEARAALVDIPAHKINDTGVQGGQYRLYEVLGLAERTAARCGDTSDKAPSYVTDAVANLKSWINHRQ